MNDSNLITTSSPSVESQSDVTQRISRDLLRLQQEGEGKGSLLSHNIAPAPSIERSRQRIGALVRLIGAVLFLLCSLLLLGDVPYLWEGVAAFGVWSAVWLFVVHRDLIPKIRRPVLLVGDVAVVTLVVALLGASTTPVAALYVLVVIIWSSLRQRYFSLLALVLSVAAYGAVLGLGHFGVWSVEPHLAASLPDHRVLSVDVTSFAAVTAVLVTTYLFQTCFVGRIELQAAKEQRLRASERSARARDVELWQRLEEIQRLEALGRLAGGIAHDFNNLMTGISGYIRFARDTLKPGQEARADLAEALSGVERASELTSQLLAFSRKQVYRPQVLDLNDLVRDTSRMLSRILGEDVVLDLQLERDRSLVMGDPGQLERVVVNLAVNARDAMPDGGSLTILVSNVTLDRTYCESLVGLKAGRYVMMAVSDTGAGIDPRITSKIFEPFFTTKEGGQSTGLGLSTVYGIVTQNGGNVLVTSRPGEGATFTIYLPQVEGTPAPLHTPLPKPVRGRETVLLVEDELMVRRVAARLLRSRGYQVIQAAHGKEALRRAAEHKGRIDLLLTDVIMPHLSGPELAEELLKVRRDVKVLYMSGYAEKVLVHQGMIEPGTELVEKPFNHDLLISRVREVLDR